MYLDDYDDEGPDEDQIDYYMDATQREGSSEPEDDERRKEIEEEAEYQARLAEDSIHNDGQGICVVAHMQATFPPLEPGKKRRKNAKKPRQVAAEVFSAHEALHLEDSLPLVLTAVEGMGNLTVPLKYTIVAGCVRSNTIKFSWSMKTQTDLPLMSFSAWEDCIRQLNSKVNTDLKIIVEELEQQEATPTPEPDATQPTQSRPEGDTDGEDNVHAKQCKKTHEKSAEKKVIDDYVGKLMTDYKCKDEKCFVDYWASAMAAGKEDVSTTKPPVHHYFIKNNDDVNDIAVLAARCRQNLNQAALPTININLSDATRAPLQPHNQAPPPKQTLSEWQENYGLDDIIINTLKENRITGPHGLKYVSDDELKEMGLVIGQRADVRDAQERWSLGVK
ncbi:hypothetical protein K435DRAFT_859771 [Dendrothele bispora CBS 962.96]|uniref:SAM domain-containing protein n=1 Tax=Dendrothele bispora (strain CBS 962.96) TaxID=1314807 RepID=A0A4S8M0B0_DENBC|nr:hypothetical protein K435DRAFT_859771 [Dendrothele bispora CBS 962.96]